MIYALIWAVIALVAGVFGFADISAGTAAIAKMVYFVAVAMFIIFLALAKFTERKLGP